MKSVLLAIFVFALQAPTGPVAPGPRASIEGVVRSADGRPIAGAEVQALPSPMPQNLDLDELPPATTDEDGRFVLRDLIPGGYRLIASAEGFGLQAYGASLLGRQGLNRGTVITLTPGQVNKDITISFASEGMISGRVTSTNGEPLLGMVVYAVRRSFDAQGWPSFNRAGVAGTTNDRGDYRITGLPPGSYYIRSSYPDESRVNFDDLRALDQGTIAARSPAKYAASYFPGVPELARAAPVEVTPRAEARNVDISLPRETLYRIRGRVVDSTTSRPPEPAPVGVLAYRVDLLSDGNIPTGPYNPDGTFEFTGIPPGRYWVNARPGDSTPEAEGLPGTAVVVVRDSDVEGVDLTIIRNLSVSGSVTVEDRSASSAEWAAMKVELRSLQVSGAPRSVSSMSWSSESKFTLTRFEPGEFRVSMSGLPGDLYIKSARFGNVDALAEVLDLTKPQSSPLNIVLARGVDVAGVVMDSTSRPVPGQQVVLVPELLRNRPDLYKTATTDANGRFTMQGVAPGDYKAFAWQSIESYRYFDPEFMRSFENRGSVVRVTEVSGATVDVRLIP